MKNILFKIGVFALGGLFVNQQANAQMVGTDIFLKGQYVEVGQHNLGFSGSQNPPPTGYHPRPTGTRLGFVADPQKDGWDVNAPGEPKYVGDYFVPGSPQEGWDIQIGSTWNAAWGNFTGGFYSPDGSPLILTGSNTGYTVEGKQKIAHWEGSMGNLGIKMRTILDTTVVYFICEVELTNNGTTTLADIYYNRTVDPDNEASMSSPPAEVHPTGGWFDFTTTQNIVHQPDPFPSGYEDLKCLVTAKGLAFPTVSYLGLGAVDCRALSYIIPGSLMPTAPLKQIYEGTAPAGWGGEYLYDKGAQRVADEGIGLVFKVGDLAPGKSTTLAYAYILRYEDLDSAFKQLAASFNTSEGFMSNGDTLEKCWGAEVEVNISGGGAYEWGDWEPNINILNPSGRNNVIKVGTETITYRVIGTSPVCPVSDTLYFTIVPQGDTVRFNEVICAGQTYDFDGETVFKSGIYHKKYYTSLGCDSIRSLNLTVNPLPDKEIMARETSICEGEEAFLQAINPVNTNTYQWYKDGSAIFGENTHTLYTPEAGSYRLVVKTNKNCSDTSKRIDIKVNPSATVEITTKLDKVICYGDSIEVAVNALPNYQYTWHPQGYYRYTTGYLGEKVIAVIPQEGPVVVEAMNQYGCKAFDTLVVEAKPCCDIYTPNAFSPNNDGNNDYFGPKLQPNQVIVSLQVFDRRGNMVYDNNENTKGWNGRLKNTGELVPQDVYMYRLLYSCTDGETYEDKGDVTIVK